MTNHPDHERAADSERFIEGTTTPVTSALLRPPEVDRLGDDWVLRDCERIEHDGMARPAIGGMALLSRVGRGGMGIVYRGVNPRLGRHVAVKVLPRALVDDNRTLLDRFEREARLAARLRSPHLVDVLDLGRDERSGALFIVMEFVDGLNAAEWSRRHALAGQRGVSEAAALDVCIAATRGLAAAHYDDVLHRDVKPANILIPLDPAGRPAPREAKLADLGLARVVDSMERLTGGGPMGTPGYMAPEQATDAKSADRPADVFGMGATLYALLAGQGPYDGDSPAAALLLTVQGDRVPLLGRRPDVSAATADLVEACLQADPADRPPDGPALLIELERCRDALHLAEADAEAPPDAMGLRGHVFGGNCRLLRQIGSSTVGHVYEADYDGTDAEVTVVLRTLSENEAFRRALIRDVVAACSTLDHPNIAQVRKFGRDDDLGLFYLVGERIRGGSLADRIDGSGAVPVVEALPLMIQACTGVHHAHEHGVVHGDLRPRNFLIDLNGVVHVTEFGLATSLVASKAARPFSPRHMAPEQIEGKPIDRRADVYALGVTFFHTLSGTYPHDGEGTVQIVCAVLSEPARPLRDANPRVRADVAAIVDRMLVRDLDARYQSLAETIADLRTCAALRE